WLYDRSYDQLEEKVKVLTATYARVPPTADPFPNVLKWSETLKRRKRARASEPFDSSKIRRAAYRPFDTRWLYQSDLFIDRPGLADDLFPADQINSAICFSDPGSRTDYCLLAIGGIADLHFGAAVDGYQQVA